MAWTLIASAENALDASGTTMDATTALNVAAGDLLVGAFKHEGAVDTMSCAKDSGSPANTFTFDAGDYSSNSNNDLHGTFGYVLSAAADATATFRMTDSAARPFRGMIIYQFRPDASETVTKDGSNTGQGNSTAPTSGTITTTGTDEVVFGMYAQYSDITLSAREINNVAADGFENALTTDFSMWYRILTATIAGAAADATMDLSNAWLCNVIAFKSEAGGAGLASPRTPRSRPFPFKPGGRRS